MADTRGAAATAFSSWVSLGSAAAVLIIEAVRRRGRPYRVKLAVPAGHLAMFLVASLTASAAAANASMACGWSGVFLQLTSVASAIHIAAMLLHLRVVASRAALDTRVADEVVTYVLGALGGALSVGVAAAAWDPPAEAPSDTFLDAYALDPVYGLCTLSTHHAALRVATQTLPTMVCFLAAVAFYSSARRHLARRRVPAASITAVDRWAARTLGLYLIGWIGVWAEDFFVLAASNGGHTVPDWLLYMRGIVYSGQGLLFALFWYGIDEAGSLGKALKAVFSCRCCRKADPAAAPLTPRKGRSGPPSYGTLDEPAAGGSAAADDPLADAPPGSAAFRPAGNLWGLDIPDAYKRTQQRWIGPAPQPLGRGPRGSSAGSTAVLGPPSPQLRPPYSPSALDGLVGEAALGPSATSNSNSEDDSARARSSSGSLKPLGITGGARLVAAKMSPPQRGYRRLSAAAGAGESVRLAPYEELPSGVGNGGSSGSAATTPSSSRRYRSGSAKAGGISPASMPPASSPSSSSPVGGSSGSVAAPKSDTGLARVLFSGGNASSTSDAARSASLLDAEEGGSSQGESASLLGSSPAGGGGRSRFSTRQTSITVMSDELDDDDEAAGSEEAQLASPSQVPGAASSSFASAASPGRSRAVTSGSATSTATAAGLSVSIGVLAGDPDAVVAAAPPGMRFVRTYTVESDEGQEGGEEEEEEEEQGGVEDEGSSVAPSDASAFSPRSVSADAPTPDVASLDTPSSRVRGGGSSSRSDGAAALSSLLADSPLMLSSAAGSVRRGPASSASSSEASSSWQSPVGSPMLPHRGGAGQASSSLLLRSPSSAAAYSGSVASSGAPDSHTSPAPAGEVHPDPDALSPYASSRPSASASLASDEYEARLVYELAEDQ